MSEAIVLGLCLVAGVSLGAAFFGGLWWTVRRGVSSKNPALLFLGSMLLRTGTVVAGFYVVSDRQWQRLLACLLGFLLMRIILMRLAGRSAEKPASLEKGARHAP